MTPSAVPDRPLMAAGLMIGAMSIIGVIDNLIAPMSEHVGLWQFHLARALMALPLVVVLAWAGFGSLRPQRIWAVSLRSGAVALSMLFYFSALAILPIAQALAGLFTSPILILLITGLVMGQPVGAVRIVAVLAGFLGILFVLQPDPAAFDWRILIPVAAGFFYALGAIFTRSFCAGETTIALLLGMWLTLALMGAAGSVLLWFFPVEGPAGFATRAWEADLRPALPYIAVQAVGSVVGVFLIIKAYQLGEPGHVAVFEYSVMIFGPLFAWIVFAQTLGPWQLLGIALIIGAGSVIGWRSARGVA